MKGQLNLDDQVIVALRRITRAIDLHSRYLLKQCGLTTPQLTVLRTIGRYQPIRVSSLARRIHLGQATVTGILYRLEGRGLITRSRANHDRRSVLIALTPEGETLTQEAPSPLQDRFRDSLSELSEWEQTMILATLQRIASMMDADRIDASPVLTPGDKVEEPPCYLDQTEPLKQEPTTQLDVAISEIRSCGEQAVGEE